MSYGKKMCKINMFYEQILTQLHLQVLCLSCFRYNVSLFCLESYINM